MTLLLALFLVQEPITAEEFASRRTLLMERMGKGVGVIDGSVQGRSAAKYDLSYLAGYSEKDAILFLDPTTKRTVLFVEEIEKAKKATGLSEILSRKEFPRFAEETFPKVERVYARVRPETAKLIAGHNGKVSHTLAEEIVKLRLVKSKAELALIRKASDATCKAHVALYRVVKPGANESEVQKTLEKVFKDEGCPDLCFPSICGSGKNGTILHYEANREAIPADSLIVCDIGAAVHGYGTDITRTLPTSGKFTEAQREKYQLVRDAQTAAEKILKPGATLRQLHVAAAKVFEERKATKWSFAHSGDREVRHGLGHFVGMYVHDSGSGDTKFEPGMVITIEPGWYDRDAGWGIRIEDMYLVTADGFERLSAAAPREIDEIEKAMKP